MLQDFGSLGFNSVFVFAIHREGLFLLHNGQTVCFKAVMCKTLGLTAICALGYRAYSSMVCQQARHHSQGELRDLVSQLVLPLVNLICSLYNFSPSFDDHD